MYIAKVKKQIQNNQKKIRILRKRIHFRIFDRMSFDNELLKMLSLLMDMKRYIHMNIL